MLEGADCRSRTKLVATRFTHFRANATAESKRGKRWPLTDRLLLRANASNGSISSIVLRGRGLRPVAHSKFIRKSRWILHLEMTDAQLETGQPTGLLRTGVGTTLCQW